MTVRLAQVLAGGEKGGAENFFVRLGGALAPVPGLEQRAFLRPHPDRFRALEGAGVPCNGFRFGGPLHWLDRARYRHALRGFRPDVVMTWMNRATAATPSGDYQLVARLGSDYNLKYYRHCDHWIGISRGLCDYLVDGGMPAERVHHVPNFASETPTVPVSRTAFDTPDGAPLILAAGRLHETKGFDVLIRAMAGIPDAVLWLAGEGPEEPALKSLAGQLGVGDRVRFLGWWQNIASLLQTVDLFVCPSRHEGLGSVVLEAWANGCPIVATRAQGPEELIEPGETGLLTPVDEAPALQQAVRALIGDPPLRSRLAAHARARYQAHYSQSVILERYRELLSRISGRPL
ncbi:MAG: glycosyltransferase [Oleiphilaceae bacterium]|nr:glycosyltransferase [Oleiphilaceae bacterium]